MRFCFIDGQIHAVARPGDLRPGLPSWVVINMPVKVLGGSPDENAINSYSGKQVLDIVVQGAIREVRQRP